MCINISEKLQSCVFDKSIFEKTALFCICKYSIFHYSYVNISQTVHTMFTLSRLQWIKFLRAWRNEVLYMYIDRVLCISLLQQLGFFLPLDQMIGGVLLAHLSRRLEWAIVIARRPLSVVVVRPSVNFSHFQLLLQNHLMDFDET